MNLSLNRKISAVVAAVVAMTTVLVGVVGVDEPAGASSGTYQCSDPGYSCTTGGYNATTAQSSGWPWSYYGGSYASYNSYGPHNCTLYAAFRLENEGITLNWHANGSDWARVGAANGVKVDTTPSVGAIAQWDAGHVAYVEAITPRGVVITDDNYSGSYTTKQLLTKTSNWPSHFLHFARRGGATGPVEAPVMNPDLNKALSITKPQAKR